MSIQPSNRIVPLLHKAIIAKAEQDEHRSQHFSASGIRKCIREWYYALSAYPSDPVERRPEWVLSAEVGNRIHDLIGDYFQFGKQLLAAEETISGQPYSGRIDYRVFLEDEDDGGLDVLFETTDRGENVVVDLKTMNSRAYADYDHAEKKRDAHAQVMSYLEATGYQHGYVIALNRDTCTMKEYEVTYVPASGQAIKDRAIKLQYYVNNQIVPAWDVDRPKACRFCPYQRQCAQDGEGDIERKKAV